MRGLNRNGCFDVFVGVSDNSLRVNKCQGRCHGSSTVLRPWLGPYGKASRSDPLFILAAPRYELEDAKIK